jgi:NNP family nitrate/nitrite transporter-like MFS transporter
MGIAGAGNSGTALATLFAPLLARALGWHTVFALAQVPVALMLLLFAVFAKDSPSQPAPKPFSAYVAVLGQRDTWWFCLFYAVTFGGFVGLASFFNTFFTVQYELNKVEAGYFATACVIAGSCLRPVGGYLADRFGGIRLLVLLYSGVGVVMLAVSWTPPLYVAALLLFLGMGLLGMGNGSVFQLLPQRFPKEIGVQTGIIGAAGGLGGFVLQNVLGSLKQFTGSYAGGYLLFALAGFACALTLSRVARRWEGVFVASGGVAATTSAPTGEPEPVLTDSPVPEPA